MAIKFYNENCTYRLAEKRHIASWIHSIIAEEGFKAGDISYIFCSPEHHIGINRQYLGHDYHTDVITFDYSGVSRHTGKAKTVERSQPSQGEENFSRETVSGDIFIDPVTVRSNAIEYGATARGEMLRVLAHGVLHLCGYKDKSAAEEKQMHAKEDHYLAKY